jgi:GntR family transcriptional regulator, transcriptional repressor for pyruvate dehydrogenase complex
VVREAVRSLVAKGLLEVRTGNGTFVRAVQPTAVAESLGLLIRTRGSGYRKIHEIRQLLEVEIARLAAQRASPDDLVAMEQTLHNLAQSDGRPNAFARADVAFHAALAQATQNELFSILLESIGDELLQVRQKGALLPGTVPRALHYHTAIFECVRAHDAPGAQEAMREHLEEARITLMRVLGPKAWD